MRVRVKEIVVPVAAVIASLGFVTMGGCSLPENATLSAPTEPTSSYICTTTQTTVTPSVEMVEPTTIAVETEPSTVRPLKTKATTHGFTDEEIDLIALVTMAEAEGEPELGKRLVIDVILNRVDDPRFPNTVKGVIYQKNQFEPMTNGRIDRCYVRDDIRALVVEEMLDRTNEHVMFFRTDHYHPYGTPMFSIGSHYFSEYD